MGKPDEAIREYERAIEIRENYPEAYNNMGTVFRDQQKTEQAEASYRRAIAFRPNYLDGLNNLAGVLVAQKKYDDGIRILGDTLKLYPDNVGTLINLARAQMARGAYPMANRAVQQALKSAPENVEALTLAGQINHDLDNFEGSIEHFEKSLKLRPKNVEALNYYGVALKSVGRLEDARNAFIKALEVQPRAIGTYSNLVDLEKFTPENPLFQTMQRIVERVKNPETPPYMALHFALGKAYDDMGEHARAFHHFSVGAKLKRATLTYNEAEVFAFFDEIKRVFSKEFIQRNDVTGNPSKVPIFIVGMPRSGSTLTEQIISAHPKIFGAGEIKNLSYSVAALRLKFPSLPKYPALAAVCQTEPDRHDREKLSRGHHQDLQFGRARHGQAADQFLLCGAHSHDAPECEDRAHEAQPDRFLPFDVDQALQGRYAPQLRSGRARALSSQIPGADGPLARGVAGERIYGSPV